jgi:hypothetical protein
MSPSDLTHQTEPEIIITEADMDEAARRTEQARNFFANPITRPIPSVMVVCRCIQARQDYYLVFEQIGVRAWAVRRSTAHAPSTVGSAPGQNIQTDLVSGSIDWTDLSNGKATCPHCQAVSVARCGSCRRLSCHPDGKQGSWFNCPWCGTTGRLTGTIRTLDAQPSKSKSDK